MKKIVATGGIRAQDLSITTYKSNREVPGSNPSGGKAQIFSTISPSKSICQKICLGHFFAHTVGFPKWYIIEFRNKPFWRK